MFTKTQEVTVAKFESITVDVSNLEEHVQEFIFTYGLRQLLNDAGASKKTLEEKVEAAQMKLARLHEGMTGRVAGVAKDATTGIMERLALAAVKGKIKAAGKKFDSFSEEQIEGAVSKYIAANHDALAAEAQKQIDARKDAAKRASAVDLDDLGL